MTFFYLLSGILTLGLFLYLFAALRQSYQLIRFFIRQRTQQYAIDNTEDSRICADADCQREHHDRGHPWILSQHSRGVSEVLQDLLHVTPLQ